MKVFFVDEDWDVESLINAIRNRYPSDSFELADNLADARKMLWAEKYDVLVLDIMIPSNETAVPRSSKAAGLLSGLYLHDQIIADFDCPNQKTPAIF